MNLVKDISAAVDHWMKRWGERRFFVALTVLALLAATLPLLIPGIPRGHDLFFHFSRLLALGEGVGDGVFPVRIHATTINGYGYASGLFYPDYMLYFPGVLISWGMSVVTAYKIWIVGWIFFTGLITYWVVYRIGKSDFAAFAAVLLLIWSSYFAVDLFVRAAIGEVCAFPFVMLVLLGFFESTYGNKRFVYPLVFGFAGLFLTHHISFVIMTLIALVWYGLHIRTLLSDTARIGWGIFSAILMVGLVAGFLFPMLEQMAYQTFYLTVVTVKENLGERTIDFCRLFFELPISRIGRWIPPGIGIIFLILFAQRFRFSGFAKKCELFRDQMWILGWGSLLSATAFLPWEGIFSLLGAIQFPWRFYLPATAGLAVAGALTLDRLAVTAEKKRFWLYVLLFGCGFAYFGNVAYAYAAKIYEKDMTSAFVDGGRFGAGGLHYLPAGTDHHALLNRGELVESSVKDADIMWKRLAGNALSVEFDRGELELGQTLTLILPLVGYLGYQAVLENGVILPCKGEAAHNYLLTVQVQPQEKTGKILVHYVGTRIQFWSGVISLLFWIGCVGGWIYCAWRGERREE